MLQSPEEEILAKSCDALYKFAKKGEENKLALLELGAVDPLSKLISHEDKIVRRNATMVCGIMASHCKFDCRNKTQIHELNGLEPLIKLLSSPDPDVKKNCAECIYLLAQEFQSRSAVWELNAIPPLLELLKSEYPVIQQLTLRTLGCLSSEVEARHIFIENQVLEQLLKVLETKEFHDLHVDTLLVIANCLEDVEALHILQQSGGLKRILEFAETTPLPEAQMNAAKAISKAAQNDENRKFFHEQEVERILVSMLDTDNDEVKAAACLAIAAMGENLESKNVFNKQGIPQIITLLTRESAEVRESAAFVLANLTTNCPANASAVAEADGVDALINLLSDKRDGVIMNACTVLINMAAQEPLRLILETHGLVHALIEPLHSSNNMVLSKAALTVASIACDADIRTDLRNAGGLPPLVKLLQCDHNEVRRSACWAVAVCASDELTAVELYKLGALDLLQELNLSRSRRNNFSEWALNKLLDNNLPLKYSQKGYLSYSNLIEDGFYDCGRIKPDAKLLPLEELSKQELNQNRAVILINAKSPDLAPAAVAPPAEEKQESVGARSSYSRNASREKAGAPAEEKPEQAVVRTPSSHGRSASKEKGSKGKVRLKKEEEKPKEEEEVAQFLQNQSLIVSENKDWQPPYDQELNDCLTEASKMILPLSDIKEQVVELAKLVARKMGGPIEKERLHDFSWELHISELKFALKSNVIPIGKIKKGTFYHRALLFKVLADRVGISSCLIRGEYGRAWNEVRLTGSLQEITRGLPPPKTYVVDLMFEPGRLLVHGSADADNYQHI
uniref:Armadillo repeat containing 3 n=1 Tax=Xenopus tropicalis TaxID=8364 RepID=A0A6I8QQZ8_XENTR